jgi:xanthine dehydrogenase YagS FAD-binding subunit
MKGGVAADRWSSHPSSGPRRIEHLADGGVRIGALVSNADLAHDEFAAYPAVRKRCCRARRRSCVMVANVGGNLLQRTRAPISTTRPAAATSARRAVAATPARARTALHAVLGWSESCIATHPSDFCVPLVALDAVVEIEGKNGRASSRSTNCIACPAIRRSARSVLEPGDLIVAVRLPPGARALPRMRAISRFASAPPTPLPWSRPRRAADRERQDHGGAAGARRRRRKAVACACGGDVLKGVAPNGRCSARPRRRALADAKPSGDNAFKIELARRVDRARAEPRRRRDARAHAGAAGLSLRIDFRSMPCLRSIQPALPPHAAWLEHRPAADPRDGILKVKGQAATPPTSSAGMLYAVMAFAASRAAA